MALHNVSIVNSNLLATANNAHCTSEEVIQEVEDNDFESIREVRTHWKLANISSGQSSTDTANITTPLVNGDRIVIRTNDGVLHDTIVAGATIDTTPVHAPMTSATLPAGVASGNYSNAWEAFDGDGVTMASLANYGSSSLQYQFENNIPQYISRYYLKTFQTYTDHHLYGSLDGTNWSLISSSYGNPQHTNATFTVNSPGEFSYYRIKFPTCYSAGVYTFSLLTDEGTSIDTSAITQGETPDQVFSFSDSIEFNGSQAVEKDIYFEYGTTGDKLYALALYEDVLLDGRVIATHVDFSATSNEVVEITGQVYKEV